MEHKSRHHQYVEAEWASYAPEYSAHERHGGRYRGRARARYRKLGRVRPFSMILKKDGGGVVKRTYEWQLNLTNTASTFDAEAYGVSIRNNAGTLSLNLYLGLAVNGTGTLVASHADFPSEAAHFIDVFKWMRVNKIQIQAYPIVNSMTDAATSVTDQSVQSDAGQIYLAGQKGDGDYYNSSTGSLLVRDYTDFIREPHVRTTAAGPHKGAIWAQNTYTPVIEDLAQGTDKDMYPRSKFIDTAELMAVSSEIPFYGVKYFWNHPNLAANAAKFIAGLKIRVEVQWNTYKSTIVTTMADTAVEVSKRARQLAGTPVHVWVSGSTERPVYQTPSEDDDEKDAVVVAEECVQSRPQNTPVSSGSIQSSEAHTVPPPLPLVRQDTKMEKKTPAVGSGRISRPATPKK